VLAGTACGPRALSDSDLLKYAASPYDKRSMEGKHIVLGVHGGTKVVVDFPCSDLCPQYTTRIIHYDLEPGPECSARGGVEQRIDVPVGIGRFPVPFCLPKVLAENQTLYKL